MPPAAGFGDMLEAMRTLTPSHVVFNGRVGALTGEGALTARVGERVLLIHAQANRDTRPHLIGGSAAAALYTFRQPGLYAYLNHNLIEAFLLGAAAHIRVEGEWDDDLMQQVQKPGPIPE